MSDTQPEIGERVTFIDGDGEYHRAVVVDDVPDAEYVTLVWGAGPELGEGYNHDVTVETSVYPYTDEEPGNYRFILGWDAADGHPAGTPEASAE